MNKMIFPATFSILVALSVQSVSAQNQNYTTLGVGPLVLLDDTGSPFKSYSSHFQAQGAYHWHLAGPFIARASASTGFWSAPDASGLFFGAQWGAGFHFEPSSTLSGAAHLNFGLMQSRMWDNGTLINYGQHTWGSMSSPLSMGVDLLHSSRFYGGIEFSYLCFEDGIDGLSVGGSRTGRWDDGMILAKVGYIFPVKTKPSKEMVAAQRIAAQLTQKNKAAHDSIAALQSELKVLRLTAENTDALLQALTHKNDSVQSLVEKPAVASVPLSDKEPLVVGYAVVVGSFRSKALADRYVQSNTLPGQPLSVVQSKSGMYRVYAGPFTDRKEALKALQSARAQQPGSWLLQR